MSEYMEKFSVSRLIGAPPGYVGYEDSGTLTKAVRRKPYSVVLLDEIEKAHPDVFNILLQVLDEGHLTDNYGRMIDFKNTVVIMTSNVGARDIMQGKTLGFHTQDSKASFEKMQERIKDEMNKVFNPEFLNRFDEIVVFRPLKPDELLKVIDLIIGGINKNLALQKISVEVDDDAKQLLVEAGYDPRLGARPMRRVVQRSVENLVAKRMLMGNVAPGESIQIHLDDVQAVLNER